MKFLLIQTAFPGDVILATPLIEKLHAFYPQGKIDFLVRKGNEGLLAGHPKLGRVITWDKSRKHASLLQVIKTVRAAAYDHVFNLQRFFTSGLITALSGGRQTAGFDKNPLSFLFHSRFVHDMNSGKHETERNLELIKDITDGEPQRPRLYPAQSDYTAIEKYIIDPFICVAPASVWFTKQLPVHKWAGLVKGVLPGKKVFLVGGVADRTLADDVLRQAGNADGENLCGQLTWLQTAALFERAQMNYVNDSAPLHIASAMNAPVTAFFCSTVPRFGFGPLSDKSVVIQTREKLECRPCGIHGKARCPEGHFKCAESIEVGR